MNRPSRGTRHRYITVRTQFVNFHSYPDAPDEVAFLRNRHRHIFKIKCCIEVDHIDRELEFFMVLNTIEREILPFIQLGELGSCERIAEYILDGLITAYGDYRYYRVVVSEDGENDGEIIYSPDE